MEIRRFEETQVKEETMTVSTRDSVEVKMSLREAVQVVVDLANLANKAGTTLVYPRDNLGPMSAASILYRLVGAACKAEIEKLAAGVPVFDQYGKVELAESRNGKREEVTVPVTGQPYWWPLEAEGISSIPPS